jgi:hypothetical protein
MSAGLAVQWVVVGLAVAASGVYVLRRQAPRLVDRLQRGAAIRLLRPSRGPLLRAIGRRLAPAATVALPAAAGCGHCGERRSCDARSPRQA